ncbi:putative sugar nucleotidyl transferase [Niabella insulamsoli]|uniref:putative sugar nucleotidyl transferase n=1 Tax=Niabella insulamsoli TaxID=3144874 RepID=UPI0031FD1E5C
MKQLIFTQSGCNIWQLYPFSLTRRLQDFRIGALTNREKWERSLGLKSFDLKGESLLPDPGPVISWEELDGAAQVYLVRCDLLPSRELIAQIKELKQGEALVSEDEIPLVRFITKKYIDNNGKPAPAKRQIVAKDAARMEFAPWLCSLNKNALLFDIDLLVQHNDFSAIEQSNGVSRPQDIFIEKGAVVRHCFINADEGPVYIAKDALVMEGTCIRGPVFIGEKATVKMGAKIYGATTIGPHCVVGGEIKNSIFFANSNKAHDGYLGDSVIGEWCNLGAGTSCSNMKNNVGYIHHHLGDTMFMSGKKSGVVMGDFSRTAINTSINTGTIVGVSAHVFGNELTPKYIPAFSWGFESFREAEFPELSQFRVTDEPEKIIKKYKFATYDLEKALRDADAWKQLKGAVLTASEKQVLTDIYNKFNKHNKK